MYCPKCKSENYFYVYINNQEIVLCRRCGYWEYMSFDDWQNHQIEPLENME